MAYTVPKLTDYSAAALEKAASECITACMEEAGGVRNEADLKNFRDRWMARKNGVLTQINDLWLKGAPKEAKRDAGMRVNELKARVTEIVEGTGVGDAVDSLAEDVVDISLPGDSASDWSRTSSHQDPERDCQCLSEARIFRS